MDSVGTYPRKSTVFIRTSSRSEDRIGISSQRLFLKSSITSSKMQNPPSAVFILGRAGLLYRFQLCINQNAARSGCDLRYFLVREIRAATHLSLSPSMLPISAWE